MIKTILENLDFPEGPAVDSKGDVWFVELHGGNVCRLSKSGELKRFAINNGKPNGLAIDELDRIWFCDSGNDNISILNPQSGDVEVFCDNVDGKQLDHPNDLAFDASGTLVFTCPGNSRQEPTGYVCAVVDGRAVKVIENKYFPNGLAFTSDGKKLVLAETYRKRLWIGDWNDEKSEWKNEKILVEVGGKIGPDGMAFAENGNLYVAVYGGNAIKVVSPDGEIIEVIKLDGANSSNCAFVPEGGLLVTETEKSQLLFIDNKVKGGRLFKREGL